MGRLEVIDKLNVAQTKLMSRLDDLETALDQVCKDGVGGQPVEENIVVVQHVDRQLSMAASPRFFREMEKERDPS